MMLRFSNTKSSMLFKILSVGEAQRVELDKLLDKTTVQGLSASRGLSAFFTGTMAIKLSTVQRQKIRLILLFLSCWRATLQRVRT